MNYYEDPGNTAARGSNGAERSKWRDAYVDPELVDRPGYRVSDVATKVGSMMTLESYDLQRTVALKFPENVVHLADGTE